MDLQDHHYFPVAGKRAPVLIAEIARSNVDIDDLAKVINMMITTTMMMLPMLVMILMMVVIIISVKNIRILITTNQVGQQAQWWIREGVWFIYHLLIYLNLYLNQLI